MMGMDMMLSKMIGMTPDEMKAKVSEFEKFVKTGADALVQIKEQNDQILAGLERIEKNNGKRAGK